MRSTRCWWPDRGRGGREAESTARIIDSQSVKTIKAGGPRGYDAGKKIEGSKRHIATDTAGHPLDGLGQGGMMAEACRRIANNKRTYYRWC